MKVVTPVTIDDSRLISSNATESHPAYDAEKEYKALEYCVVGRTVYQSALGIDTSAIEEFDPLKEYLTGDKAKSLDDAAVYGAISGAIGNDFAAWAADHLFVKGNYCKIVATKKVYLSQGGENPADHAEWSAETTYAADATAKVTPVYTLNAGNIANQIRVYKSKKSDNTNRPPASNLTGSSPYWVLVGICNLNAPPDTSVLYSEWSAIVHYFAGDVRKVQSDGAAYVALSDNINKPPGSNLIGSTPAWKRLESFDCNRNEDNYLWSEFDTLNVGFTPSEDVALDSPLAWKKLGVCNVGLNPADNIFVAATSSTEAVGAWYKIGSTNKWKIFDDSISTATAQPDFIEIVLDCSGCDTVALFNLSALNVEFAILAGETVLHEETVSTFLDDYTSWDEVFFKEPEFTGNIYKNFTASYGTHLKIKINAPNGTAKCGHCVIGLGKFIGKIRYGIKMGIADYSKIVTDEYGDTSLSQGKFAVTADVDLWLPRGGRPAVRRYLEARRATPVVWHMDNQDEQPDPDLVVFGFYGEFTTTIESFNLDGCSINIKGLA
ncbi:hypothetical protein [Solidesulfovibrio sp.]